MFLLNIYYKVEYIFVKIKQFIFINIKIKNIYLIIIILLLTYYIKFYYNLFILLVNY